MYRSIKIMADLREWPQSLTIVPITTDKSTDTPDRKWMSWQSQLTDIPASQRDILRRKERNKLRMRQIRALEDVEKADKRRERNKLRMRQVRAQESEEQAELRREKNKLRMRQVRAIEKMDSEKIIEHSMLEVSVETAENVINGICGEKDCEMSHTEEDNRTTTSVPNKPCA